MIKYAFRIIILLIFTVITVNVFVLWVTRGTTYDAVETVPDGYHTGLVLGTSKYAQGNINLYYKYRIDAAQELYESGKVQKLIVSGDNAQVNYNEPKKMEDDLIARGVPEEDIQQDNAGFRTLDSIIRAKRVFGQDKLVIVSQEFHNKRAVFIAGHEGIDAVGYNALDPYPSGIARASIREVFARVKLVWDTLIGTDATVLGEPIKI